VSVRAVGARVSVRAVRRALPGLTDQALASGVNFLTLILVARAVTPREFGQFALVFTLLQSFGALQLALVARPHNVLAASLERERYVRFTSTTCLVQLMFSAAAAALLALGAGVAHAAGAGSTTLLAVAAPTLVAWQAQELGRRILYTERRFTAALANDAVSYGLQAILLVELAVTGRLTGKNALLIIGATSTVAAVLAGVQLRRSLGRSVDGRDARELWRFGRWLGAAEAAYWFESQYYIYAAAAVVGAVASGALKVGQTLLGPASVYLAFFVNYLPIRFARGRAEGQHHKLADHLRMGVPLTAPVVITYAVFTALFAPALLGAVYGDEYRPFAPVVRLFALYYIILAFSDVVVASLSANGHTRRVFGGHVAGAGASLVCGWLLLRAFGAAGGVAGMIVAICVALAVFVNVQSLRRRPAAAET
jgi:O-antigen/teichoic acid export membrane protein